MRQGRGRPGEVGEGAGERRGGRAGGGGAGGGRDSRRICAVSGFVCRVREVVGA